MGGQDAGQTTAPADDAGGSSGSPSILAIRWLFPGSDGKITPIDRSSVLLGRADGLEIQLSGKEASRHHAEILRDGEVIRVRDLNSRNGVFVNGSPVVEAELHVGDILRLGEWIGMMVRASECPPRGLAHG